MSSANESSSAMEFQSVSASLADVIGLEPVMAACRARAVLTGEDVGKLAAAARTPVEFLPAGFMRRQHELLTKVGEQVVTPQPGQPRRGASTRMFDSASNLGLAPLSAAGLFRIGEDGRLYLISKSEHYHTPLGHGFPGYALLDQARQLGIPNATHNNTRGQITRQLEEELVAAANGAAGADAGGLASISASSDPYVCNRVLNLETGSLAVEAALKMILARFHRMDAGGPEPKYHGRVPVILVMGNEQGGRPANYHGTTILAQTLRGMWPELCSGIEKSGLFRVQSIRPNSREDLEAAFTKWERDGHKVAGFFHEIVMMNYGGLLLSPEFLQRAYQLCRQHDVPTVVDEIQSCLWHHDLFMFREWGLTPSFIAIGKGFAGGEYPASRLIFSAAMDCMPQFGALVTNGQEELASLAYLVTMRWARANARVTRAIGDYYERRMREFAAAHSDQITAVEGKRHLTTLFFKSLEYAKSFTRDLNRRGFDISAQTYKADCPPAVLTKIPLITTRVVVDFMIERMDAAIRGR
ncbi:MAG: aminotransferase class III-fold pyridoxal phosphate-dependent enzyme [Opitutaceae bacterium]|nr:aminotransferase class III-fold pyridoxal phosphate-dependent enzyme [Opitutaceae bacterium]